jgi:hypothetical protein
MFRLEMNSASAGRACRYPLLEIRLQILIVVILKPTQAWVRDQGDCRHRRDPELSAGFIGIKTDESLNSFMEHM